MSDEAQPLGAQGDIIGALSDRVSELTKRVASLESELDSARKRVAVYEDFDATVREALAGALRAAHQIRARAEHAGQQILEQAREERKMLLKEIERLREERDGLADEIASTRRSGFSALRGPRPSVAAPPTEKPTEESVAEARTMAAEALKGVFTELLDDIRKEASAAADAARAATAAAEQARAAEEKARSAEEQIKAAQEQARAAQEEARLARGEARSAQDEARRAAEAQRAAEAEGAREVARAAEQAQRATEEASRAAEEARRLAEAQQIAEEERAAQARAAQEEARVARGEARAAQDEARRAAEAQRAAEAEAERAREAVRAAEQAQRATEEASRVAEEARRLAEAQRIAEEQPAAPDEAQRAARESAHAAEWARATQARPDREAEELLGTPRPTGMRPEMGPELTLVGPAEGAPVADTEQVTPQREEPAAPTSNIVLMLSPVPSFARLVDLERRVQSLAQVRTLYVRDFRGGVATLALGLRVPMSVDEFWSAIARLEQPRFARQRSGATTLELRIEGEAGAGVA